MPSTFNYTEYANNWLNKRRSKQHFAHDYLEKPAIYARLGTPGRSVLCLGSGDGSECDYLKGLGWEEIFGVDNAKGLVEIAKASYPSISFQCQNIEMFNFGVERYDLVFSSLTLHYIKNWSDLFDRIYKSLRPGGRFLFTTHHPIKWGMAIDRNKNFNHFELSYKKYKHAQSKEFEISGNYLEFQELEDILFGKLRIKYYNRPISEMFKIASESGFQIKDFFEPKPVETVKKIKPDFYEVYNKIPLFCGFLLVKGEL